WRCHPVIQCRQHFEVERGRSESRGTEEAGTEIGGPVMANVPVVLGQYTVNSGAVFPAYVNSFEGFITPEFSVAAGSGFTPDPDTPSVPDNVGGALIGLVGAVGVGGGSNPNNFTVALKGALPQDFFESITFTAGGDEPGPHTLNSADATYNGADT